jgi:hypothetical protein
MSQKTHRDSQTYEHSKQYLKRTLEHLLASGRSLRDLFEFAFDKFGEDFLPYLLQFFEDVRKGHIRIEGLGESARATIIGHHVSPEERESLIRETAYYKSEKQGFSGSREQAWAEAEQEVDARLEGLIGRGSKLLEALTASVEEGMDTTQKEISQWLEKRATAVRNKTDTMKKAEEKKSSSKSGKGNKQKRAKTAKNAKKKTTRMKAEKEKVSKKKIKKSKSE